MRKGYEKKKKAVIATLSVMALSLFCGMGYYWIQKVGDYSNIVELVEEDSTMEIIAKADRKQKEVKNKAKTETTKVEQSTTKKEDKGEGVLTEKVRRPEDAIPPATPPKNKTTNKNSGTKKNNQNTTSKSSSNSKSKSTNKNGKSTNKNSNKSKESSQPYNGQIKDGMIYVEGFGWVKYSGGGSIVHDLPGAGTGEIVADM